MKFIVGKKLEMSQVFQEDGTVVPVTVVQAGPCTVTQVKKQEKDGYTGVQIGFGEQKKLKKPQAGHLKDLAPAATMKEFRIEETQAQSLERGQVVTTAVFTEGDVVKVTGTSKGKGFAGVVKRHGFKGQGTSHGVKDQTRMPGSSGSTGPAHVFKGTRKPGRMGGDQVTVDNLVIVKKDDENGLLYIKGALPGARNSIVYVFGEGEMDLTVKPEPKEETVPTETVTEEKPETTEEKPETTEEVKAPEATEGTATEETSTEDKAPETTEVKEEEPVKEKAAA